MKPSKKLRPLLFNGVPAKQKKPVKFYLLQKDRFTIVSDINFQHKKPLFQ